MRVSLTPKPFAVLQYLVEHAGCLVTQDELLAAVWPETHVQPEVLRRYILEARRALGDPADEPRFIETVPKRGYRFMPDVTSDDRANAGNTNAPAPEKSGLWRLPAITAVLAVFLAGGVLGLQPRRPATNETLLLADFTNSTGDSDFDGSLRQGLSVQLEQSPVLRIVSEERIQETLRLMKRQPDQKLVLGVALEVCQRTGSSTLIEGSIARMDTKYSLILRAVNCANGESLSSAEAQAEGKDRVLEALGKASSDIRHKLGESRSTIQKFDIPLAQATTSSLEALRAYSLGRQALNGHGDSAAAIPFLQRAVEIDPAFAMAYVLLGDSHWNLGENTLASANIRKAYDLRAGVSEWEKLRIESEYYSLVACNYEAALRTLEVWAQIYPRDPAPQNRLGNVRCALGQFEKALAAFQRALRLDPESSLIRGNLIYSYIALDRLREARSAADEAQAKNPDAPGLRVNLYRLAFLENDGREMARQVGLAGGIPGLEDELLASAAATASYFGQIARGRNLYRQAMKPTPGSGQRFSAMRKKHNSG